MTMNQQNTPVIPFAFDDALVRALWVENDPWFVLVDVCRVLGIANSRDAASRLDDDEKGCVGNPDAPLVGGNPTLNIVSESGLYALIFRSRKPEAVRFRKWVTSEVIPSLRKTGRYAMPGASDDPAPGTGWNAACWDRSEITALVSMVRECRSLWGKSAAQRLWQSLPLPQAVTPGQAAGAVPDDADYGFIAAFLDACTAPERGAWVEATPLYQAYDHWCIGEGILPVTMTAFGRRLASLGVPKRKKARMSYGEFVLCEVGAGSETPVGEA
jgi:prophage antirepressor-like protein